MQPKLVLNTRMDFVNIQIDVWHTNDNDHIRIQPYVVWLVIQMPVNFFFATLFSCALVLGRRAATWCGVEMILHSPKRHVRVSSNWIFSAIVDFELHQIFIDKYNGRLSIRNFRELKSSAKRTQHISVPSFESQYCKHRQDWAYSQHIVSNSFVHIPLNRDRNTKSSWFYPIRLCIFWNLERMN